MPACAKLRAEVLPTLEKQRMERVCIALPAQTACGSQLVLCCSALVTLAILGSRSNIPRDKAYGSIEEDVLKVARVETHASLHV